MSEPASHQETPPFATPRAPLSPNERAQRALTEARNIARIHSAEAIVQREQAENRALLESFHETLRASRTLIESKKFLHRLLEDPEFDSFPGPFSDPPIEAVRFRGDHDELFRIIAVARYSRQQFPENAFKRDRLRRTLYCYLRQKEELRRLALELPPFEDWTELDRVNWQIEEVRLNNLRTILGAERSQTLDRLEGFYNHLLRRGEAPNLEDLSRLLSWEQRYHDRNRHHSSETLDQPAVATEADIERLVAAALNPPSSASEPV